VTATHLADTSALAQLPHSNVAAALGPLLVGGRVATCGLIDLELLALVGSGGEHGEVLDERRMFPRAPIDDAVFDRAIEVAGLLAGKPVAIRALVVAATAECAGLVLLHHDAAFDRIAEVSGQPTEWVGS
jgi:predicted nucleic acid-binding protein